MKKCPFCAEEIQDEAIKCRFCGEYLKKKPNSCLIGCLIALAVFILLIIALGFFGSLVIRCIIQRSFSPPCELYYPPFKGFGFGAFMRDFFDGLRGLLDRLREFFPYSTPKYI